MNNWQLIVMFVGVAAPLVVAGIAAIVRLGSKQMGTEVKVEMMGKDISEMKRQLYDIGLGLARMEGSQRGPDRSRQQEHGSDRD